MKRKDCKKNISFLFGCPKVKKSFLPREYFILVEKSEQIDGKKGAPKIKKSNPTNMIAGKCLGLSSSYHRKSKPKFLN